MPWSMRGFTFAGCRSMLSLNANHPHHLEGGGDTPRPLCFQCIAGPKGPPWARRACSGPEGPARGPEGPARASVARPLYLKLSTSYKMP